MGTISENNLITAQDNYNYWLEVWQDATPLQRILKGYTKSLNLAKENLDNAQKLYLYETEYNPDTGDNSSITPIIAVAVIGLICVAIFINYLKK